MHVEDLQFLLLLGSGLVEGVTVLHYETVWHPSCGTSLGLMCWLLHSLPCVACIIAVNNRGFFYVYEIVAGNPSPRAVICPVDTYGRGLRKQQACVPCPPGFTTNNVTGRGSSEDCGESSCAQCLGVVIKYGTDVLASLEMKAAGCVCGDGTLHMS